MIIDSEPFNDDDKNFNYFAITYNINRGSKTFFFKFRVQYII